MTVSLGKTSLTNSVASQRVTKCYFLYLLHFKKKIGLVRLEIMFSNVYDNVRFFKVNPPSPAKNVAEKETIFNFPLGEKLVAPLITQS